MMKPFEIEIRGTVFKVIPLVDPNTKELFYVVSTGETAFRMRFNNDMLLLAIDRPAPYIAYEYELPLADRIQAYNDNLL